MQCTRCAQDVRTRCVCGSHTASSRTRRVLALTLFLFFAVLADAEHLVFPATPEDAIVDEDIAFCSTLAMQARPEPPTGGWDGPLKGAPDGLMVWGKLDKISENQAPAPKFFVVGDIKDVTVEATIATVEGTNFTDRRQWDPSCLVLETLKKDGRDDVVVWKSDFPWPLSDRDFVYRRRIERDDTGGAVSVSKAIQASGDWVPVDPKVVRVNEYVQYVSVRQLEEGNGVRFAMLYRNNMEFSPSPPPWVISWFTSTGLPRYLNQLVAAAKISSKQSLQASVEVAAVPPEL